MSLSKELQLGKAGEHFVCFDLIMKGYNAFLADQGLPFDILAEKNGQLVKIQVKSTSQLKSYDKAKNIYRFGTRRARGGRTRARKADVDYFAFVAMDIKAVAYLSIKEMLVRNGNIKQTIEFKTKQISYPGRIYSNGTVRTPSWSKYIEDYGELKWGN